MGEAERRPSTDDIERSIASIERSGSDLCKEATLPLVHGGKVGPSAAGFHGGSDRRPLDRSTTFSRGQQGN